MPSRADILAAVAKLKMSVYRRGERRAPHKPLLLLLALANLRHGERRMRFGEIEEKLDPLLNLFAPPVKGRHQPELPYWHLQTDGLWVVDHADEMPLQQGGFPQMKALRESSGGLPADVVSALAVDPNLEGEVIGRILADHFPESLHEDILEAVGLDLPDRDQSVAAASGSPAARDPSFRLAVLRAYGHSCALTGFHIQLRGAHLGLEAAHVHWHSHGGPDEIANGLALQSTMHKLLDAGAWALTDDRRVLVSADLTGGDETTTHLRGLHGKPIREPLKGFPAVSVGFIRWHREPQHGGIFRTPSMPL